jgi:hypothetical protein
MPTTTQLVMDSERLHARRQVRRRVAIVAAVISATAAAAGVVVWVTVLSTRPPCPSGYVRLIDFAVVMPFLCGGLLAVSLGLVALAARTRAHRFVIAAAVVLTLIGGLAFVGGAATVASYRHQTEDPNCWTF